MGSHCECQLSSGVPTARACQVHLVKLLKHSRVAMHPSSKPVLPLLFADDLVHMSRNKEGLQRLLYALQMVCEKRRLRVSLSMKKAVVFEPERQACGAFIYDGHVLRRSGAYKYLGLWFEATTDGFANS